MDASRSFHAHAGLLQINSSVGDEMLVHKLLSHRSEAALSTVYIYTVQSRIIHTV